MIKDLMGASLLATLSVCIGVLINQFRDKPLPVLYQSKAERLQETVAKLSPKDEPAAPTTQTPPENIDLAEMRAFVRNKSGLILDARPEIFHRVGHIPGALSLPREEFEKAYETLRDQLEASNSQTLVVYCSSPSCEDSDLVRNALVSLGYSNVAVFREGWSGWTKQGFQEEAAQ